MNDWKVSKVEDRERSTDSMPVYKYGVNSFWSDIVVPDQQDTATLISKVPDLVHLLDELLCLLVANKAQDTSSMRKARILLAQLVPMLKGTASTVGECLYSVASVAVVDQNTGESTEGPPLAIFTDLPEATKFCADNGVPVSYITAVNLTS